MNRLTELSTLLRTGLRLTQDTQNEHLAAWRRSVGFALARRPGRQPTIDPVALAKLLKTCSQAEAARRLGVSRQAIHQLVTKSVKREK